MLYTVTFLLNSKIDIANINVSYCAKMEVKEFTIDCKVTLGLPGSASRSGV